MIKRTPRQSERVNISFCVTENLERLKLSNNRNNPIKVNQLGTFFRDFLNDYESLKVKFENVLENIKKYEDFKECSKYFKRKMWYEICPVETLIYENIYDIYIKNKRKYLGEYENKNILVHRKKSLWKEIEEIENEEISENLRTRLIQNIRTRISLIEEKLEFIKNNENGKSFELSDTEKIENIYEESKSFFYDIDSIIFNFKKYLEEDDEYKKQRIKQYLLWTAIIPRYIIEMAYLSKDGLIFEDYENIDKITRKKLDSMVTVKDYQTDDFRSILDINIDLYFQNKFAINKCENCGKYFIPKSKSNEKYCDNLFDGELTCKEYAPKHRFNSKIATQKYNMIINRYRSKINHETTVKLKEKYQEELELFREEYKKQRKKAKKEEDIINWLMFEIKEYEIKYAKRKKEK